MPKRREGSIAPTERLVSLAGHLAWFWLLTCIRVRMLVLTGTRPLQGCAAWLAAWKLLTMYIIVPLFAIIVRYCTDFRRYCTVIVP